MKAVVYPAKGAVALRNLPEPEPGPGEVLIRIRASGICHTDIDVLHARYGPGAFPVVPGHEFAGDIAEIGDGVTGFSVGDRVVVDPNLTCGTCRYCRKGLTNLCETLGAYGVTRNGGFNEFGTVRADNLVAIGDLPFNVAALAEPMGCVLNGLRAVGTQGVETSLIFGAGPIGLLMAIALASRGVPEIMLCDTDEARLAMANSFGFAAVASGSAALAKLERGIDLTINATGVPRVAEGLVDYTASGGGILFFGVCPPDAHISLAPFEIFRRQLRIAGAHSLNHNIPEALRAIRAYGPGIARLVSHNLPLAEVPDFLTKSGPQKSLKVQAVC